MSQADGSCGRVVEFHEGDAACLIRGSMCPVLGRDTEPPRSALAGAVQPFPGGDRARVLGSWAGLDSRKAGLCPKNEILAIAHSKMQECNTILHALMHTESKCV